MACGGKELPKHIYGLVLATQVLISMLYGHSGRGSSQPGVHRSIRDRVVKKYKRARVGASSIFSALRSEKPSYSNRVIFAASVIDSQRVRALGKTVVVGGRNVEVGYCAKEVVVGTVVRCPLLPCY